MSVQMLSSTVACEPEAFALLKYNAMLTHADIVSMYQSSSPLCGFIKSANLEKEEFTVLLSDSVTATMPFKESRIQSHLSTVLVNSTGDKILSFYCKSLIGTYVTVHIHSISGTNFTVSRIPTLWKSFNQIITECQNPNSIYKCVVLSIATKSVFVDIGGGIVGIVPIQNLSCLRYTNLKRWIHVGDSFYAKMDASSEFSKMKFTLSRKEYSIATISANTFQKNDIVSVLVGDKVPTNDGYFVELTPGICGVMDSNRVIREGSTALGVISKITPDSHLPCGYRIKLNEVFRRF